MNTNLAMCVLNIVWAARWWIEASNDGAWWTLLLAVFFVFFAYHFLVRGIRQERGAR